MHTCAVDDCPRRIAKKLLMCAEHWAKVSPFTQKRVWETYRIMQAKTEDLHIETPEERAEVIVAIRDFREATAQAKSEAA